MSRKLQNVDEKKNDVAAGVFMLYVKSEVKRVVVPDDEEASMDEKRETHRKWPLESSDRQHVSPQMLSVESVLLTRLSDRFVGHHH